MGLKADILAIDDLPREPVEIPEWGVTVYVREMTGSERDLYESDLIANKDMPLRQKLKNMRANMVVLCTVDDQGQRLFADDDVDAVGAKSATALNRIVEVAQKANAIDDASIEDIAGN